MNIVLLSGSSVGSKTRTSMNYLQQQLTMLTDDNIELIDLRDKSIEFSDGRNYLDYHGDTLEVTTA